MTTKMHTLSKSTFVRGCQCEKSLYLNKYHKEFQSSISTNQEAVFWQGKEVGILARQLFPNGIDASPQNYFSYVESIKKTKDAIKKEEAVIYEAAFLFDDVLAAVDILVNDGEGWKAFEVKSSTEVKDTHILDAALQYYLIQNTGIILHDIFIVHINNEYVRGEELETEKLFVKKSILKEVLELQTFIPQKIEELKAILKQNEIPVIEIGLQCYKPYPCDFLDYCWKKIPTYSVFDIANLKTTKKFELFNQGIIQLQDIPQEFALNANQWQQINCELEQKSIIDKPKIEEFLGKLIYPLYFLDFETFQLAIPKFVNSRPYQQLVFQYSLHKQNSKGGNILHFEFIAETNSTDPRIFFIKKLIDESGEEGDIIVYNKAFEKARLEELAIDFPEFAEPILKIINRLKDLMIPFRERWYYIPEMKGSYSIKFVLPALVPDFSYTNLEIKDGNTASTTYSSMVQGNYKGDKSKSLEALLEYCKLDTLAMVKILQKLFSLKS